MQSFVPIALTTSLQIASASTVVDVTTTSGDLVEADPVGHTDVDRDPSTRFPSRASPRPSARSSPSPRPASPRTPTASSTAWVTTPPTPSPSTTSPSPTSSPKSSPTRFPWIPSSPSKSFPACLRRYGGKTSLVIVATTRSGLGESKPTGEVTASYGSFGSSNVGFNLATGSAKLGNFISANVMDTGRFLDPPEFHAIHDKGNEENLFDRIDYQISAANSATSTSTTPAPGSRPPTPTTASTPPSGPPTRPVYAIGPNGAAVGPADQRAQIQTVNLAPSYTHVINTSTVFNAGYFFRRDGFNYYPSKNPFADLGAPDLQQESLAQQRSLANTGLHSDLTYTHGGNNIKAGLNYAQTFLNENFQIGIVDPTLVPGLGCQNPNGSPIPGTACATLQPYDLTEGG